MGISIKSNGAFEQLRKKLTAKKGKKVEIGFFDSKKATIASYLEYGWVQRITPKQAGYFRGIHRVNLKAGNTLYMPPRPFMRGTFEAKHKEWIGLAQKFFKNRLDVNATLEILGNRAVEDIQASILKGGTGKEQFAPRSPLTMALIEANLKDENHKTDGTPNTSQTTKPLYRSGSLFSALTFRMVDK